MRVPRWLVWVPTVFILAIAVILFAVPTKPEEPQYVELLQRISGQKLSCTDTLDEPVGSLTLSYNSTNKSLLVDVEGRQVLLSYSGRGIMRDYFRGPGGKEISIDPEIKHRNMFGKVGGYCWE